MTLTIRPAVAGDLDASIALLQDAGLPSADLTLGKIALVAEKDQLFQGVIGMESFGRTALLRSLIVSPAARGSGVGPALVTALEAACVADSVGELWLLTIEADRFFEKLGYVVRQRDDAPDSIRSTGEFSGLCPDDAVLMSKAL